MRKICILFLILSLMLPIYSAYAVETVEISTMTFTNNLQQQNKLTSKQWVSTSYTRAIITITMCMDFMMDNHSKASFNDVAYMDSSYIAENDGMIIAILRGRNYLEGYYIMLMYTPADLDGAYSLFSDSEYGSFAMLREALIQQYENVYENEITDITDVCNRTGMNYYLDSEETEGIIATEKAVSYDSSSDIGECYSCGLISYKENGKWGFLDTAGNVAIAAQWDYVNDFDTGLARVFVGTLNEKGYPNAGKHGVINTKGEYIIPLTECNSITVYEPDKNDISITYKTNSYDWNYEYWRIDGTQIGNKRWDNSYDPDGSNMICALYNQKWGYVDRKTGNEVLDYQYDIANPFSEGIACVGKRENNLRISYYYIDETGKTIIENKGWDYADSFEDGINITTVFQGSTLYDGELPDEGKYALINRSGDILCDYIWDKASSVENDLIIVSKEIDGVPKWGIIDGNMDIILKPQFDYIRGISEDIVIAFDGTVSDYGYPKTGVYNYFDLNGRRIGSGNWSRADFFTPEGYAIVGRIDNGENEWFGIIDKQGNIVLDPVYEEIADLTNTNLILIKKDGKYGYINLQGDIIIDIEWDDAEQFSEDRAVVWKNNEWHIIDSNGNYIK